MSKELKPIGIKRALIIAISDYDHLEKLGKCKKDGKDVLNLLEKNGYLIKEDHKLIGKVGYVDFRDTVYNFFKDPNIGADDTVLFYFSGHGIPDDDNEHYFASSEIDPDDPSRRGLSFDEYSKIISRCNTKVVFSILDCCYSGAAKISKGNKTDESNTGESIIKEKLQAEGKCTLSSCKPMQKSYFLENNSLFTTFLLEGLEGGNGKSADDSGCVTPELLLNYIDWKIRSLPKEERQNQTPFLRCERTGGKIILSQFARFSKVRVSQPENTRNSRYLLQQGTISFYKGEYAQALSYFNKIIKDPNYVTALHNKGLVLDSLNRYRAAISFYKKALDIQPNYFPALFMTGYELTNLGENREALTWYDKALKIRPKDRYSLYNKAFSFYHLGEYEQAINWYNKLLKIDPRDLDATYNKALALHDLGKYQEALIWYDKALKIDPRDRDTLHNKGLVLYQLHKFRQAIACYEQVLEINPTDTDSLRNKGMALDELGKYQEALIWYDKALKIEPNNSFVLNIKGATLRNLDRYQEAIRCYDEALKFDPDYLDATYNKALALHDQGKYQEALIWYDKALKIDPKDKETIENRNDIIRLLENKKQVKSQ